MQMKAELEPIVSGSGECFYARRFEQPVFDHPFHYHPEIEIAYIVRSSGTLVVGDYIDSFARGDLYLIGPNLPHIFRHSEAPEGGAASEVIHFQADELGAPHFAGAEWASFRDLLVRSRLGLQFDAVTAEAVHRLMVAIRQGSGLERMARFIELAQLLLRAKSGKTLASVGYSNSMGSAISGRMERVCQYLLEHFDEDMSHRQVAETFHMSPAAFSRSFRQATRKTYQAFLNELRLGHACRLLRETDATITEIAYRSGFKNLSNFNRRFKEAYGRSPREHRASV